MTRQSEGSGWLPLIVLTIIAGLLSSPFALRMPPPAITGAARRAAAARDDWSMLLLAFTGPLVLVGIAMTLTYMRWPRALTRRPYYVVLFLILLANGVMLMLGGWLHFLTDCRECDQPLWWPKTVLVASLFVGFGPIVKRRWW